MFTWLIFLRNLICKFLRGMSKFHFRLRVPRLRVPIFHNYFRKHNCVIGKLIFIGFVSVTLFTLINHVTFDWQYGHSDSFVKDDYIAEWNADDVRLIDHIRSYYLHPPSSHNVPYNLKNPDKRYWSTQRKQSEIIEELFQEKRHGFFVECGAFDGETYSNTLSLEKYFNWTGILIEPDYLNLQNLLTKNRKSWIVNGCLEGSSKPKKMTFYGASYVGGLAQHMSLPRRLLTRLWQPMKSQTVWCFPLLSILLAVNQTRVDYFSLDVEGAEMAILRSLDWRKITIDVVQVEYTLFQGLYFDRDLSKKRKREIIEFMTTQPMNFKLMTTVYLDLIFRRKSSTTHLTLERNEN